MAAEHRLRKTTVVTVDPATPDPASIAEAAAIIRGGGLVAFPTETVYGLGANALDAAAVASIFSAKGRALDDPVIVHVSRMDQVTEVARAFPALAQRLARAFWPGPLTIVLERAGRLPAAVSGGLATVAVRMPSHAVALALIDAAGTPVAAPSANRFQHTSATTAAHVLEDLDGRIDMVLDGGPAPGGIESTVVSLVDDGVILLRPGAIALEELRAQVSDVTEQRRLTQESGSPGLLERHYAPRKPLVLVDDPGAAGFAIIQRLLREAAGRGERPGLLLDSDALSSLSSELPTVVGEPLGPAGDATAAGNRLYRALRALDHSAATVIFARTLPAAGLGAAVNDRLRRAAAEILRP
jgi:L-threonylcarbamoyladenylate synthase